MALSWRIALGGLALLMVRGFAALGYGQGASGQAKTGGGSTSGGRSKGAGAEQAKFQGVTDSYAIAQEEIEAEGGEQKVGEYRVGYIVEPAEGWWDGDPAVLQWRRPLGGKTNHVEILPFEAESGLLVPAMQINLTILDESGEEIESNPLEFYRGEFDHYANNFSLPESGAYTLKAELNPPGFRRHETDESSRGKAFTEAVTVESEDVEINTEGE